MKQQFSMRIGRIDADAAAVEADHRKVGALPLCLSGKSVARSQALGCTTLLKPTRRAGRCQQSRAT